MTPLMRKDAAPPSSATFCHEPPKTSPIREQPMETDLQTVPKRATNCCNRHLSRLVSQEQIFENKSPHMESVPSPDIIHPFPDFLKNQKLLRSHVAALRLETDLYPLRLVLSRLMSHPTHNRKGIFNQPVDPVALGLPDYDQIVRRPMDLGTVKRRLYAIAYRCREEAIQDIRLVFTNAIKYNSPLNPVHISARELLSYFDRYCQSLDPPVSHLTTSAQNSKSSVEGVSSSSSTVDASTSLRSQMAFGDSTSNKPVEVETACSNASNKGDGIPSPLSIQKEGNVASDVNSFVASPFDSLHNRSFCPDPRIHFSQRRAPPRSLGSTHVCYQCEGRTCSVCLQGCLQHEPALLVCSGAQCAGSRIRKSAMYFTTRDGSHQICDRCFVALPSTVPSFMQSENCRYKQDLLRRKNNEEIAEEWVTCSECTGAVHVICAMHNGYAHDRSQYKCHDCRSMGGGIDDLMASAETDNSQDDRMYTFVSGSEAPVPLENFRDADDQVIDSSSLKECPISIFIEEKIRNIMSHLVNAGKTLTARVISDCDRTFSVPKSVRRYFRMSDDASRHPVVPPASVEYRQKAIVVFQKIDGLDVCVFCMYVQEYEGENPNENRVYIAYIDSVDYFRPRELRTQVFHEILVAYLATARERGYSRAHIWACPPSRGNCFVFWNHPISQRVPTADRLQAWYHSALSRGIDAGVVVDVKSLYESDFEKQLTELSKESSISNDCHCSFHTSDRMLCPPLIDGDFWIEEAVRVHQAASDRNLRARYSTEICVWNVGNKSMSNLNPCPAVQVAALLKDRIMTHPSSVPFRRPVNAAALKLRDYHKIVKTPMDLGTIYSRCILGEYQELRDVVHDVNLMVTNAKKFNPPGHIVNSMATEVLNLFDKELNALTMGWGTGRKENSWQAYKTMSMSLNVTLESYVPEASSEHILGQGAVVIEDDRSSDGSRSQSSSSASEASHADLEKATADANSTLGRALPKPIELLDLHADGVEAVMQKMVGEDGWLLNKKRCYASPKTLKTRISIKRKHRSSPCGPEAREPATKKLRQTWLCEEVGLSVRKMRTSLFSLTLSPPDILSAIEEQKLAAYKAYVTSYKPVSGVRTEVRSCLADTRSALLELSQFRNFEFDTLRKAKYSTSMLLYHIRYANAPGGVPVCTTCGETIKEVRWHKAKPMDEFKIYLDHRQGGGLLNASIHPCCLTREDLCAACYEPRQSEEAFIPIPVSLKPASP
ncbi:bromodomain containing protein [Nitzschia inconspicua]|uniref:histone acetyltransferase n=1 Tax=Nitzschia inconspicua TaxID=303405 RepID=A0A9K3M2M3_9STRA|nr:bromodomain containing protein [Nitzschia inconspicua]